MSTEGTALLPAWHALHHLPPALSHAHRALLACVVLQLNTFTAERLTDVLGSDSRCYLADVSLHYYPYYK